MNPEYALFWFLFVIAGLGWPVAFGFAVTNHRRLARIEKLMKGINNA